MSPVAVSADRRFHRAHVKPARRRGPSRALLLAAAKYTVLIAAAVAGGYRGLSAVTSSPFLRVDRINLRGNVRMSNDDVLAALDGLRGENLVTTDLEAWRVRLTSTPWIRDAALRRVLPSTVNVVVTEREPIGIGRVGERLYVVDERGAMIDDYDARYAELDLPIIDGLTPPDKAGTGDDGRHELAARLIMALRAKPAVGQRVSQVDVSNPHNAAVIVNGDPALIYLGEDRFMARLESYLGLAPTLHERVAGIDYVDLRFDDRIFLRPAAKARGGSKSAPGGAQRK